MASIYRILYSLATVRSGREALAGAAVLTAYRELTEWEPQVVEVALGEVRLGVGVPGGPNVVVDLA